MANRDGTEVNRSQKESLIAETLNGSMLPGRTDRYAGTDLLHYWVIFRSWRRDVAYTTVCVVLITSQIAGVASALLGGGDMGGVGQSLSGLAGKGQDHDPDEVMAMMRSYAFTVDLAKQYKLIPRLLKEPAYKSDDIHLQWRFYRLMKKRFTCDYDYRTDLINMYFVDPDPLFAQQVLGYYVESLRNQLRNQEVGSTAVAITSLEEEAGRSADPLLRDQLYLLVADQIQNQKMAQMDASYSFRVIEPAITPDEKYWPSVRQFCLLALVLTPILMIVGILAYEFCLKLARTIRALEDTPSIELKDGPFGIKRGTDTIEAEIHSRIQG
jgi:hypothetical protein